MRFSISALVVLSLSACIAVPVVYEETTCRVDGFASRIGREATGATAKEILRVSGARTVRWVKPHEQATPEINPERVTAWIGADNLVARLNCG